MELVIIGIAALGYAVHHRLSTTKHNTQSNKPVDPYLGVSYPLTDPYIHIHADTRDESDFLEGPITEPQYNAKPDPNLTGLAAIYGKPPLFNVTPLEMGALPDAGRGAGVYLPDPMDPDTFKSGKVEFPSIGIKDLYKGRTPAELDFVGKAKGEVTDMSATKRRGITDRNEGWATGVLFEDRDDPLMDGRIRYWRQDDSKRGRNDLGNDFTYFATAYTPVPLDNFGFPGEIKDKRNSDVFEYGRSAVTVGDARGETVVRPDSVDVGLRRPPENDIGFYAGPGGSESQMGITEGYKNEFKTKGRISKTVKGSDYLIGGNSAFAKAYSPDQTNELFPERSDRKNHFTYFGAPSQSTKPQDYDYASMIKHTNRDALDKNMAPIPSADLGYNVSSISLKPTSAEYLANAAVQAPTGFSPTESDFSTIDVSETRTKGRSPEIVNDVDTEILKQLQSNPYVVPLDVTQGYNPA